MLSLGPLGRFSSLEMSLLCLASPELLSLACPELLSLALPELLLSRAGGDTMPSVVIELESRGLTSSSLYFSSSQYLETC